VSQLTRSDRVRIPPETLLQVHEWERTKSRYINRGLCDRCAAQAAWAHQNMGDNWKTIHPPCERCAQIVATFPHPTPSPDWRKTLRQRVTGPRTALTHAVGPHATQEGVA
jgi:hypothetical protein